MNNKGQLEYGILILAIVGVVIILLAPVMLKMMNQINSKYGDALGNITTGGGDIAKRNVNLAMNTGINMWDQVLIFFYISNLIILIISSFFVDSHPMWLGVFIFLAFITVLIIPSTVIALDNIYDSASFSLEKTQLPFMNTLRTHFAEILVGEIFLIGVILYGKSAFNRNSGGGL